MSIDLDEKQKICFIGVAKEFKEEERRQKIHIAVKKWFQKRTEEILSTRLEEWSRFMNIPYQSYRVNDTISKYGSCMPKKQKLFFTLRLAMLPEKIIDSIIVHELCHMIHPDHSKDFYALVKKYIEDYDECDKWLKNNSQYINL